MQKASELAANVNLFAEAALDGLTPAALSVVVVVVAEVMTVVYVVVVSVVEA